MSLYNMTCGNNPLFGLYARILETVAPLPSIPRFRDMYTRECDGGVQIVIYTRTGGGNRDDYEDENGAMAAHPLFVCDFDDEYDPTFAHFVYSVPEKYEQSLLRVHRAGEGIPKLSTPADKFQRALDGIRGESKNATVTDEQTSELAAALEAIEVPEQVSSVEKELCP